MEHAFTMDRGTSASLREWFLRRCVGANLVGVERIVSHLDRFCGGCSQTNVLQTVLSQTVDLDGYLA